MPGYDIVPGIFTHICIGISPLIVFDNIIFSLQHFGGISSIWKQIILATEESSLCDKTAYIEYSGADSNVVRKTFSLPKDKVETRPSSFLKLKRYLNPTLKSNNAPFIFHSSYYRYSTNPLAINVTTVHDFTYERYRKGLAKWCHSRQKRKAIINSEAIVCISDSTRRDLIEFLGNEIDESKIHLIPNCIDPQFAAISNDATPIKNLDDCILFVGSRVGYKNFIQLVDALAPLKQYRLVICGSALTPQETSYLDRVLGKNRYLYGGQLNATALASIYKSVHCLVYPSAYEGFGLPIIEAQTCGCPVIALNSSSIPEVIGDQRLMLQTITSESLEETIDLIDKNRNEIIASGISNSQRFTPENTINSYLKLYEQLL